MLDGPARDAELSALFGKVLDTFTDLVIVTEAEPLDEPGPRVVYVNSAFTALTGYPPEAILGRSPRFLQGPGTDRHELDRIRAALHAGDPVEAEIRNYRADGTSFYVQLFVSPVRDAAGRITHYASVQRDTTARWLAERELAWRADRNGLTGLLTRAAFVTQVGQALQIPDRGHPPAVVLLDVRGLRTVNNTLGRDVGDGVIVEVARRLDELADGSAVTAQISGGEFGLLVQAPASALVSLCERALRVLMAPVQTGPVELSVHVTGGVAVSRPDSTAESLLREADLARGAVRASGSAGYDFYEPAMGAAVVRRMDVDQGLRRAVALGELVLHHQSVVTLDGGTVLHAEALVRWDRPGTGMVSPGEFVPLAEESGAIMPVGAWVLEHACRDALAWQEQRPGVGVAVNLSPRQLADPDLLSDVDRTLAGGLPPDLLTLEVTEGALIADPRAAGDMLRRLRRRGVRLALDDFGTGFSSLAYLTRLPVDSLKIDKAFVDGVESTPADRAIIRAVLGLARDLGLSVVAEGVETEGQRQALLELGCERGQGYLFARPVPLAAFLLR